MAKSTKRKQKRTINEQPIPVKGTEAHEAAGVKAKQDSQKRRPSGPTNDENADPTSHKNGVNIQGQPNTRSRAQASGQKTAASSGQAPKALAKTTTKQKKSKQKSQPPVPVLQAATETSINVHATDDDEATVELDPVSPKGIEGKKATQHVVQDSDIEPEGLDDDEEMMHLDESEHEVSAPRKVKTTYKSRFKKALEAEEGVDDNEPDEFEASARTHRQPSITSNNSEIVAKRRTAGSKESSRVTPGLRGSAGPGALSDEGDVSEMAIELQKLKQQLREEKEKTRLLLKSTNKSQGVKMIPSPVGKSFTLIAEMRLDAKKESDKTLYNNILATVRAVAVQAGVNFGLTMGKLPLSQKAKICTVAKGREPYLARFEDDWATIEILRQYVNSKRRTESRKARGKVAVKLGKRGRNDNTETTPRKRARRGETEEPRRDEEFLYNPDRSDNINIPYDPLTFNHGGSDGYLWRGNPDSEVGDPDDWDME